jgi:hypothetical protein
MAEERTIGLVLLGIVSIMAVTGLVILLKTGMTNEKLARVHRELDVLHGEAEIVHVELDRLHEEAELIHAELELVHKEMDTIEGTMGITVPTTLHMKMAEIDRSKAELDNRYRDMYHRLKSQQDERITSMHELNR